MASTAPSNTFQHQDLPAGEIRLCKFSRRSNATGIISCDLRHFKIRSQECPGYRALSYEWGPPDKLASINVNGLELQIRQNLFDYLKQHECRTDSDMKHNVWLWVDQICINQQDAAERTHQVQAMDWIYGDAESVVAWVGAMGPDAEMVLHLLCHDDVLGKNPFLGHFQYQDKSRRRMTFHESRQAALFFDRTYFRRLWIVQEVLLAREVLMVCGTDFRVSWSALQRLQRTLKSWDPACPTIMTASALFEMVPVNRRGRYDLSDVLVFSKNECADVLDKVYGLQALVKPGQRVFIDYSMSLSDLLATVGLILQSNLLFDNRCLSDLARSTNCYSAQRCRDLERATWGTNDSLLILCMGEHLDFQTRIRREWHQEVVDLLNEGPHVSRCPGCSIVFRGQKEYGRPARLYYPQAVKQSCAKCWALPLPSTSQSSNKVSHELTALARGEPVNFNHPEFEAESRAFWIDD